MEIAIIFETAFRGDAGGAVWIVESPENRDWFEQQVGLDEGSAVFKPEGGEIGRRAVLRCIWNVQEHYPRWSQINVSGVSLTTDLAAALHDEGTVTKTHQGFSLARNDSPDSASGLTNGLMRSRSKCLAPETHLHFGDKQATENKA